jgi:hypothetical protein
VLLWVIIAWLAVVGGTTALVGARGYTTYRRARDASGKLQVQVARLESGGLATLAASTARLQEQMVVLEGTMQQLSRALAGLRVLLSAWSGATGPARWLIRLARR